MRLVPKRNSIFVLPDKSESKSGSIILTDYSKKRPTSGTIIAIGPTAKVEELKVGSRIIYGEFSGAKEVMNYGGIEQEIFIMQPEDILAELI